MYICAYVKWRFHWCRFGRCGWPAGRKHYNRASQHKNRSCSSIASMPNNINSASRLVSLLKSIPRYPDNTQTLEVWATLFGINEANNNKKSAAVAELLAAMYRELELIREQMHNRLTSARACTPLQLHILSMHFPQCCFPQPGIRFANTLRRRHSSHFPSVAKSCQMKRRKLNHLKSPKFTHSSTTFKHLSRIRSCRQGLTNL
jgi:hypothetical protein